MKSLQVLTPARICIFNCPFCIAKTHKHNNQFINNYENDYIFWKTNYIEILKKNYDLKTIVITGTNEPIQDKKYIKEIIKITREYRQDIKIELQTRYYKYLDIFNNFDIVAYSISDYKMLNKIDNIKTKTRYVLILTNSFDNKKLKDILDIIPNHVKQLTFKVLHDSHGNNLKIDNWIKENKISSDTLNKLKKEIIDYQGDYSIIYDETCMDAENRYMVFREDGLLYTDFESIDAIKI